MKKIIESEIESMEIIPVNEAVLEAMVFLFEAGAIWFLVKTGKTFGFRSWLIESCSSWSANTEESAIKKAIYDGHTVYTANIDELYKLFLGKINDK